MRPRRSLAGLALVTLAAAIAAGVLWALPSSNPGGGLVTGRVLAPTPAGTEVLVVDPQAGVGAVAFIQSDGAFRVRVPEGAREPWIVVDTHQGALVQSRALDPVKGADLPPVALWTTDLRVRQQGPTVRIDWGAVPQGEGLPRSVRYSLLVTYRRDDGDDGEATFPLDAASVEMDLKGDLLDYLKRWDPKATEVGLKVRAFDPTDLEGPMWIGGQVRWRVDTGEVRPEPR